MAWTVERVALLKKLWEEGFSASQIAQRLGLNTRYSVMGKIHRLGLSGRAKVSQAKPPRPPTKAVKINKPQSNHWGNPRENPLMKPAPVVEVPSVEEELVIPIAERKTLETLTENSCRWPIGDTRAADFHFCGKTRLPRMPYCEYHARKSLNINQPRKREVERTE